MRTVIKLKTAEHIHFCRRHGIDARHDMLGFYLLTDEEAEHEDAGNPSVGFDLRSHWLSLDEAYAAGARRIRRGDASVTE